MFDKFGAAQAKKKAIVNNSGIQKLIASAIETMPAVEPVTHEILPKKVPVNQIRVDKHLSVYTVNGKPVLVELGTKQVFPHLKVLFQYRGLFPQIFVDEGAVKALLRGADLMAPGIKGMNGEFSEGSIVEIILLGQEVPFAIGTATVDSSAVNGLKGPAITILHKLNDGLYTYEA